jgi:hypothetical protein
MTLTPVSKPNLLSMDAEAAATTPAIAAIAGIDLVAMGVDRGRAVLSPVVLAIAQVRDEPTLEAVTGAPAESLDSE